MADSALGLEKVAIAIIQQAIDLVHSLQDEHYTYDSKVMPAGTIGKHIRHVYDHFNLLQQSCTDSDRSIVLDYDLRSRNNPSEMDRSIAIQNLHQLQENIPRIPLGKNLKLLATIDASDTNKYEFQSSFGRELFYSCIHAIHHYAAIKAICIELDLTVPKDFGMAPSTLQAA
ncbi:uncharacterized protein EV154DRAFT_435331 [Mucor mucedo]|uniref:uncharacterized protein n=1 Tax=Mucor mucedo TaxID=29922 RepID=UPI00221E499F|nr:uncharacterized protein EV154DRAFT_435331 [Mucor mucedo]KAI7896278.1 hypothetical protein EV154DRAFT_435331 [Mucor mucedo]